MPLNGLSILLLSVRLLDKLLYKNSLDIIEAAEKRKDARVYREVEFALPNELTNEQNIEWSDEFC